MQLFVEKLIKKSLVVIFLDMNYLLIFHFLDFKSASPLNPNPFSRKCENAPVAATGRPVERLAASPGSAHSPPPPLKHINIHTAPRTTSTLPKRLTHSHLLIRPKSPLKTKIK